MVRLLDRYVYNYVSVDSQLCKPDHSRVTDLAVLITWPHYSAQSDHTELTTVGWSVNCLSWVIKWNGGTSTRKNIIEDLVCFPLLHYFALHCSTLHCTALSCTALHPTALHYFALHCSTLHCTALHCTALHTTALHYFALHCSTLHCTELHCTDA